MDSYIPLQFKLSLIYVPGTISEKIKKINEKLEGYYHKFCLFLFWLTDEIVLFPFDTFGLKSHKVKPLGCIWTPQNFHWKSSRGESVRAYTIRAKETSRARVKEIYFGEVGSE